MKKAFLALLFLITATAAHADRKYGVDCRLNIGGQADWHFSLDLDEGIFTAYRGNDVFKRRSQVTLERQYGSSIDPKVEGAKFLINFSPMEVFLYYRFSDKIAYVMPMSGSNPRAIGTCQDSKFRGL